MSNQAGLRRQGFRTKQRASLPLVPNLSRTTAFCVVASKGDNYIHSRTPCFEVNYRVPEVATPKTVHKVITHDNMARDRWRDSTHGLSTNGSLTRLLPNLAICPLPHCC